MMWMFLSIIFGMGIAHAETIEERSMKLHEQLMAPCCWSQTLNNHHSEIAGTMRRDIKHMLEEGKTDREILDHFIAQYGKRILSQPPAEGFNLTAYVLPVIFLMLGGWVTWFILKRWGHQVKVEAVLPKMDSPVDGVYAERLAKDIQKGL